jgi:uncharacterized protein
MVNNASPLSISMRVVGRNDEGFASFVIGLVRRHVPELAEESVFLRVSRDQNYVSVVVPLVLQSKEQFDAVYRELTAHDRVLMVL